MVSRAELSPQDKARTDREEGIIDAADTREHPMQVQAPAAPS
jgi:hypothetical protein